jgi:hypothetical protein
MDSITAFGAEQRSKIQWASGYVPLCFSRVGFFL